MHLFPDAIRLSEQRADIRLIFNSRLNVFVLLHVAKLLDSFQAEFDFLCSQVERIMQVASLPGVVTAEKGV
mgnify:CR=1 FL=1